MTSFVKHIAVLAAALMATTALAEKSDDDKSSKPDAKETAGKKPKKSKGAKKSDDPNATKKSMDIPVPKGHDAKGLRIPYYGNDGKLQMNFVIGVASRIDDNHLDMTDMQVETFNEDGEHEMQIDLPSSILNTDTSVITTNKHVTIRRADFDLTGESMIFNTKTKQGGLGGNVRMLIYNLADETSDADKPAESKGAAKPGGGKDTAKAEESKNAPDSFKTPSSRSADSASTPKDKPEKFYTPGSK